MVFHQVCQPARQRFFGDGATQVVVLTGTARLPLARYRDTPLEHFPTPDAPRLAPLEGTCQAGGAHRATAAQALGLRDQIGSFCKPQFRVVLAARRLRLQPVN